MKTHAFKTLFFVLLILNIFISGCSIIGKAPTSTSSADSVNLTYDIGAENAVMYNAVVVRVEGEVSEKWVEITKPYFENPEYAAIILWIDSPGGSVTATKIVAHKLQFLKEKYHKHLYVFTEKLLASGAYWIACVADEIIAAPSAQAGSIGVYMVRIDARKYYFDIGIQLYFITSHPNKVRGNNASEMTPEEQKHWQELVDKLYYEFMAFVWEHRALQLVSSYIILNDISQKQYKEELSQILFNAQLQFVSVADGSLYDNKDAYLFGLIDRYMYFDEFVNLLNSWKYIVYNIDGDEITDLYYESKIEKNSK